MNNNRTPVLILFVITIGVVMYNYVYTNRMINNRLKETIEQQQHVIDRKTKENQALSNLVVYMYRANTGRDIPSGWNNILNSKESLDSNPVH